MKKIILLSMLCLLCMGINADEPESVTPTLDFKITKRLAYLDFEGQIFTNTTVVIQSFSGVFALDRVKVTIKNESGKNIYKKVLYGSHLYIFTSGQIQIGTPRFDQIIIGKDESGNWIGKTRIDEGIY